MPSEIRDVLRNAAAQPTRSLDMRSLWSRSVRLTWSRRIITASAVGLLGLGAWGSTEVFGDGEGSDRSIGPAGASELDDLCAEFEDQLQPAMSIFLRDGVSRERIATLRAKVAGRPGVVDVAYVSQRVAYRRFRERYKEQPEFYKDLPRDALPASLEVRMDDIDRAEGIAAVVRNEPGVEAVTHGKEILDRLCEDPGTRGLLRAFCRDPEFLDLIVSDLEALGEPARLCKLVQSP